MYYVTYKADGRIDAIGPDHVTYKSDGSMERVGNMPVHYETIYPAWTPPKHHKLAASHATVFRPAPASSTYTSTDDIDCCTIL